MAFSVNTNPGAFTALQALTQTNRQLGVTQNRINTGLAVAGASDGAATFAIAQNLRADIGGLNAVTSSLDRSISVVDVALNAAESISDLLVSLRETAVAASDTSLDADSRTALADEFGQIVAQIDSIVAAANFNDTSLISSTGQTVTAIDADGNTIFSVAGSDLSVSAINNGGVLNSTFGSAASASASIGEIDAALSTVNSALSVLGAGQQRLELQRDFTVSLRDSIDVGIGNLVDADLARESANLQALQVRQQLGLQALSIANQAPGAVLALF